jgi:predicted short-subunit dehydrogenase-like oxidoreductase (DUF2520 family)
LFDAAERACVASAVDLAHFRSIGLVGAGRLGSALAAGLLAEGYRVSGVCSQDRESARELADRLAATVQVAGSPAELARHCDLVFLTVPDREIQSVAEAVPWEPRHAVVHCSGALGLDVLRPALERGAQAGCFHPLQSFPSRVPAAGQFVGIYCGIEAATPLDAWLEQMATSLGAHPFRLEGIDRAPYHAAAVLANNLVVALAAASQRAWALAGLPQQLARPALSPLLTAGAANVASRELVEALTGPLARGDFATVQRHLAALAAEPDLREVYRALSAELLRLPLNLPRETLQRLTELLEAASPGP